MKLPGIRTMVLLGFLLGHFGASAQQTLRVGSYVTDRSIGISRVIKPWVDAVQADAAGALNIDTYWGGTLGKHAHRQYELVQSGILDVTWVLPGYTSGQFTEMGLFELPFLFESATEAAVVGWRLWERGLLTGFEDVVLVGFFTTEPNTLFMRTPINRLADLQHLKIRSLGAIQARWLELFGASPQTLPAAEMNQALDRDVLDGVIQGWTGMQTFRSYPLVSLSYDIPIGTTPFLLLMNRTTYEALPAAAAEAVKRHGGLEVARSGGLGYTQVGDAIREGLARAGRLRMLRPEGEERAAYRSEAQDVHEWWIERTPNGREVYDTALAIRSQWRAEQ